MLRLSMSELTTFRWTFEEDVVNFAAAGFQGIGVWRQKLAECGEEKGLDLLCESGLAISSLTWAGGFTGSDGRSFQSSVDDAIEALRLAAAIRAECLVVYTGGRGGHTNNHAQRLVADALERLVEESEGLDVTIAIEPMHPACGLDWTFLSSLDSALDFIQRLPRLQLVFDTYQWASLPDIVSLIPDLVPHLALVQLGDGRQQPDAEQDRWPVGTGNLPLAQITQTLIDHGYDGFFEVELMGPEIETWNYDSLIAQSAIALTELASVEH